MIDLKTNSIGLNLIFFSSGDVKLSDINIRILKIDLISEWKDIDIFFSSNVKI